MHFGAARENQVEFVGKIVFGVELNLRAGGGYIGDRAIVDDRVVEADNQSAVAEVSAKRFALFIFHLTYRDT